MNDADCFQEATRVLVVGIQFESEAKGREQLKANCEKAAEAIRAHDIKRRDNIFLSKLPVLYILPELSNPGYGDSFKEAHLVAENEENGFSYSFFSETSKALKCWISYGIVSRAHVEGRFHITQITVDSKGDIVSVYHKRHICNFMDCAEREAFVEGPNRIDFRREVFSIGKVKFGTIICYDIRFPELLRQLSIEGNIDCLVHPGGWPRDNSFSSWHTFVTTRALENQIYIASINKAGNHNGGSIIHPPWNDWLSDETEPIWLESAEVWKLTTQIQEIGTQIGSVQGIVDLEHISQVRRCVPYRLDRRTDIY